MKASDRELLSWSFRVCGGKLPERHLIRLWPQHWWCNKAISLYLSSFLLLPRQIPGSVDSLKELLKQANLTK